MLNRLLLLLGTFLPSGLRLLLWRVLGHSVGRGCYVAPLSLVVADRIEMAPGAVIETLTMVYRPQRFAVGERARIASFVRIIGYRGQVVLGPQSFIGLGCLVDSSGDFELGPRSQVGPRCTLYTHGATGLLYNARYPHRIGPIRFGADCWVGMGVIVGPSITVGDRVIILPGLTVRANIPSDNSVVVSMNDRRLVPTGRLLIGVTDADRMHGIDGLLRMLGASTPGSRLDDVRDDLWRLTLPGGKAVHLLRTDKATVAADGLTPAKHVIWTLPARDGLPPVPTFCFDHLTVYNGWTPFAEQVAAFLCRDGGAHFVWAARKEGGVSADGAKG